MEKMADILYVRNRRPNAVLIRVDGIKYTVERRGSREDSAALPATWRDDPGVSTFLNQGVLEEISKDAFMALGSRPEETIVEERGRPKRVLGPTEIPLRDKRGEDEVNIPINNPETSREPYVITEADLRKSTPFRSPNPQFASEVRSTAEDLKVIEEARKAAETTPATPVDENAELREQVAALSGLVQQLLDQKEAAPAKTTKKAPAKKATAKRSRSAKAGSVSPMDSEGKEELTTADLME